MWTIPTGILQHRSYDCRYPRYILPKDRFQRLRKGMKILEAVQQRRQRHYPDPPVYKMEEKELLWSLLLPIVWVLQEDCKGTKMSQTRSHLPSGKKRGSLRPEFSEWGEACRQRFSFSRRKRDFRNHLRHP